MFRNAKFSEEVENIIVDVSHKFYNSSSISMSDLEFSKLSGIEMDILGWYYDWCILDGNIYFFKNHDIFNELFMSELACEYMIKCVSFKVAMDTSVYRVSNIGIISKLYRKKENQYLMYSDFCKRYFNKYVDSLCLFREKSEIRFGKENAELLMCDIFKLISFDMFSGQWDRFEHNFYFECDKGNNVRMAPLCDNGLSFSDDLNYFSPFGNFSLSRDNGYDYDSFVKCLKEEKVLFDSFLSLLDINIKKVLERTCEKYKILIKDVDMNKIMDYFDNRKIVINDVLKRVKR